jgi:peroxiredoxin Q/BCP
VKILGISFDPPAASRAFAEKFQFNFPLLCDTERTTGMLYGACDDPQAEYARRISYLIDAAGRIEQVFPKVDARTHPATLLASL